jgi:phospholipid/cholesterol/gamma-HCH transport system ATP-binding protein
MTASVVLHNISHSFGAHAVLRDVSVHLHAGDLVGLIGPSGGGKSVLLKLMAGVLTASSGQIELPGGESQMSFMFQEGALFDSMTVFDNIAFPLVNGNLPLYSQPLAIQEEVRGKVSAILARVGLTQAAFKIPAQLSGGMRRRVSLARALVARPQVLLLDDPTAGLDPVASSVIMRLIGELYHEYKPATVIVSHDLRRLLPLVQRVWGLFNGQLSFDGPVPALSASPDELLLRFVRCRYDI